MKCILGFRDIQRGSCESLENGMRGFAFGFIGQPVTRTGHIQPKTSVKQTST